MKIYVASSWRNTYQPAVVLQLRNFGFQVYDFRNPPGENTGFAWSQIDLEWKDWDPETFREKLQHPLAVAGFKSDKDGMDWAEVCVLVMPCGRSAHLEAGYMAGAGKLSIVLLSDGEPELMYKLLGDVCVNMDEVLMTLELANQDKRTAPDPS